MTVTEARAEVFWTAFQSLSKNEKSLFLHKLFLEKNLRQDLIDLMIVEQREQEASRPLSEYLKDRAAKGN
jgi:hypothetical protein